jgi:tetratricopeptide (TPR) repeat protein
MINLHDILDKSRSSGQKLAPGEASVLFAAAVRLAATSGSTLRSRLLEIDELGGLHLLPFDETERRESEPSYLAPELLGSEPPRRSEPRVQVYAAGALGYELLIGKPAPQRAPGPELNGPLGDIVRMALSADRRERFGGLTELLDALEGVQARPPAEGERNILASLRTRMAKPPLEKEALARLIEKVASLEQQMGKVQARAESLHQSFEHFEDGQRRLQERKPPSVVVPAFFAGVLGAAAVLGAGFALGLVTTDHRAKTAAVQAPPAPVREPEQQTKTEVPRKSAEPAPVQPETPSPVPAKTISAPVEKTVTAPVDAGAAEAAEPPADAGAQVAQETPPTLPLPAAEAPRVPPPSRTPPPKRLPISPAAMTHAVALSQVRRGETALEHGKADDALASFRGALDNDPAMAAAYRGMGMAFAVQGDDTQALKAYEKYLQLSPGAADATDIRRSMSELKERAKLGEAK